MFFQFLLILESRFAVLAGNSFLGLVLLPHILLINLHIDPHLTGVGLPIENHELSSQLNVHNGPVVDLASQQKPHKVLVVGCNSTVDLSHPVHCRVGLNPRANVPHRLLIVLVPDLPGIARFQSSLLHLLVFSNSDEVPSVRPEHGAFRDDLATIEYPFPHILPPDSALVHLQVEHLTRTEIVRGGNLYYNWLLIPLRPTHLNHPVQLSLLPQFRKNFSLLCHTTRSSVSPILLCLFDLPYGLLQYLLPLIEPLVLRSIGSHSWFFVRSKFI